MARFHGVVGFGFPAEEVDGIWTEPVVERTYFGDVKQNTMRLEDGASVNANLTITSSIEIMADDYAIEHTTAIRYVSFAGGLWTVSTIEPRSPRLLLRLGGVYNGPVPSAATPESP